MVTPTEPGARLTIEQLAERVGMTVRNVRAYRSRGLLPPPRLVGRRGYYGEDHVRRLRQVRQLHEEGFNLAAIRAMLAAVPPGTLATAVERRGAVAARLRRSTLGPWLAEQPLAVDLADLLRMFGGTPDPRLRAEAVAAGLLEPVGEDTYLLPSPTLAGYAAEAIGLGLPPGATLRLQRLMLRHGRQMAETVLATCGEAADPALLVLASHLVLAAAALELRRRLQPAVERGEPVPTGVRSG